MSYGTYIRISQEGSRTEDEVREQLDIYEAGVRDYAKRNDLTISEDDVVRESDVSGYSKAVKDRGLEKLILRVESGDLEGVLAPNLERFARDVIEGSLAEKRITDAGGTLRTVEDGYASDAPGSKLVFHMRMAVAEDYARRAGEGLRTRKRRFIEAGGWSYTPAFGYKLNKDKRPVVVEKDARVVRELFRRRANGEQVATLADELGLPVTRTRSILGNRFYLGEVRLEEKKGVYTTLKNHHAPIIASEGAWQAAQMKGEYHARDGSIAAGCKLAGLVHCATCGERCRSAKTGRKGLTGYTCTEKKERCNAHCSASAHLLDPYVEDVLERAVLAKHPAIGAIIEGSTAYSEALGAVEAAQAAHDEYRDDVEAQETLGMKSWLQGLKVRADRVVAAREALTEARKGARPEWWEGKTGKVPLEKFLEEDERRRFARFIDRIVISPAGLGTGKRVPLAERVQVYFIGDTEAYIPPAQKEAAA